ncbi:hypothetical protein K490DRAFT_7350, partial [Saccharata proteae CBS 121410]
PRKRSVTACRVCRDRKKKCDNQRPICGSCIELKADCVYPNQWTDFSYDPASLAILERLNVAVNLLEAQNQKLFNTDGAANVSKPASGTESQAVHREDSRLIKSSSVQEDAHSPEPVEFAASSYQAVENILRWPIFEGRYDPRRVESLLFCSEHIKHQPSAGPRYQNELNNPQANEDETIVSRTAAFLRNVHIKNPILDAQEVMRMSHSIAMNGFKWDAQSCLVLMICALGTISGPFVPETWSAYSLLEPDTRVSNSVSNTPPYRIAEDYYTAARKRIGLLDTSMLSTQCYFLSGVYEMYTLRPLQAWKSFHQACTCFQTYLKAMSKQNRHQSEAVKNLEHRLYWSCLKSECEIRNEIDVPSSGLDQVSYTNAFPSPPVEDPRTQPSGFGGQMGDSTPQEMTGPDTEQSWFYYLAEIAIRRIANRITNAFYLKDSSVWSNTSLDEMIRDSDELELQLDQWNENLPERLKRREGNAPDELCCMASGRFEDFRERVFRPFLYLAVHNQGNEELRERVDPLVQKHLDACVAWIQQCSAHHRHHGIWYVLRQEFGIALMILAAIKSGMVREVTTWVRIVGKIITDLEYWEDEASDIREAKMIIQEVALEL